MCNITKCHPGVACDNTTDIIDDKTNPCGPCPIGYSGDGLTCGGKNIIQHDVEEYLHGFRVMSVF